MRSPSTGVGLKPDDMDLVSNGVLLGDEKENIHGDRGEKALWRPTER